jgi:hypothetical protein
MALTKTISCRFYQQGSCRNGQACDFIHERNASTQYHFNPVAAPYSALENLTINVTDAVYPKGQARSTRACKFFMQGSCNKGDKCNFAHPLTGMPPRQAVLNAISLEPRLGQQNKSSHEAATDSRASVPCRYLSLPSGCRNSSCPYLHVEKGHQVEKSSRDSEPNEDEVSINFSHQCRYHC